MTPEEHLTFLQDFLSPLYQTIEDVVTLTRARFEADHEPIEVWYFCDSIRYGTKIRLKKNAIPGFTVEMQDINNNGLEILLEREGKKYCLKVYKAVHGLLPAPGPSILKLAFWEQGSLFPNDEVLEIVNLAVTWHVDGYFNLMGLDLCRPALISGEQDIGQQRWSIPIPHPATGIIATPLLSEDLDSYDQQHDEADEDQDDLDISSGQGD